MTENGTQKRTTKTESFICPNCGGGLRHDSKKDNFLCPSCGFVGEIHAGDNTVDEFDFSDYARRESETVPFSGMAVANCQNCGSQVTFEERETATTCPMCGSTQIAEVQQKTGIPPEGIIPFRVDSQEAGKKFREWIKGLWFAPNKLKKFCQEGKLTGRFVPFWTFDANAYATYTGEGGKYRKVKDKDGNEHTETDWFPTAGMVQQSFDDILVAAGKGEDANYTDLVGPYDTAKELRPYAPEYLAGYQAEVYSVRADEGFETAKNKMQAELLSMAEANIDKLFDTSRSVRIAPRYTEVTYKHVLLPVWSSVFAYSGETYRYMVNGATGKVYGQRPYSIPKILRAVVIGLAVAILACGLLFGGDDETAQDVEAAEVSVSYQHNLPLADGTEGSAFCGYNCAI